MRRRLTCVAEEHYRPPPTFDERMREGKSDADGLAGAMPMRQEHEKPWHTDTHYPTRCNHENDR